MSFVTQEMIDECSIDIGAIIGEDLDILRWCVDEYKNFMIISREEYKLTLNMIADGDYSDTFKDVAEYFLTRIDEFAATRLFYFTSVKLFNEIKDGNQ